MRILFFLFIIGSLCSCWTRHRPETYRKKVIGNKAIFETLQKAKEITYENTARSVQVPGNICAIGNKIYQLEFGKGIHVIDNSIPSQAHRIGFIKVNGSSQLSIKDDHLYVNSFNDLVVLDISNNNTVTELNRLSGTFPDGMFNYWMVQPDEPGYYECTWYADSLIVGWRKDSIWNDCYKD
ncbi:MAG: hypothetical protein JST81_04240 [Bacteroidetes bacterium]|nr:hypothetical protein [Bacteroidota bacterium]